MASRKLGAFTSDCHKTKSEAGSYSRLTDLLYHSTLGTRAFWDLYRGQYRRRKKGRRRVSGLKIRFRVSKKGSGFRVSGEAPARVCTSTPLHFIRKRIFIVLITSDRKLKASREGSK